MPQKPKLMFPDVVVDNVTPAPAPPALTEVISRSPLVALSAMLPFVVVALATESGPLLLILMLPAPVTLADESVLIVVSRLMPVAAVTVRLLAVTLFADPLPSRISPPGAVRLTVAPNAVTESTLISPVVLLITTLLPPPAETLPKVIADEYSTHCGRRIKRPNGRFYRID